MGIRTRLVPLAMTVALASVTATMATGQEPSAGPTGGPVTMSGADDDSAATMPAFDWRLTGKLPGIEGAVEKKQCSLSIYSVSFLADGEAAVAGESLSCGPAAGTSIWRGGDGSWRRDGLKRLTIPRLAAADTGLVVAGSESVRKAKYRSTAVYFATDGKKPERVATFKRAQVQGLLETPSGVMAIGLRKVGNNGRGTATIWTSQDGRTWSPPQSISDAPSGYLVGAVRTDGRTLVTDATRDDGALWISDDGATWTEMVAPAGASISFDAIAVTPDGFVASVELGSGEDRTAAIWRSDDGITWTPTAGTDRTLSRIASGPQGVLAIPRPPLDSSAGIPKDARGVVLWSSDGTVWCQAEVSQLDRVYPWALDIAEDGRIIAGGTRGALFDGVPALVEAQPVSGSVACTPLPGPAATETITLAPSAPAE